MRPSLRRLGIGGFLAGIVAIRVVAVLHQLGIQAHAAGDIDRFFAIATIPGRPWADAAVEYPPLTVGLIDLTHLLAPGRVQFGAAVIFGNLLAEAMLAVALWRGFSGRAALVFLVADSLLFDFVSVHLDLWGAAGAAIAVALWRRGRPGSAGAVLALAAAIKLWPLALLGVLVAGSAVETRRRLLRGLAVTGGLVATAWVAVAGGPGGVIQVLSYRGARGWQIESTGGALIRLFSGAAPHLEAGAHRVGTVPPGLGPLLLAAGLAVAVAAGVLGARTGRVGLAWIAGVAAMLSLSTLLSPQYIVWLLPGVAIAWHEGDRRPLIALVPAWIFTWVGTFTYGGLLGGEPLFLLLVVLRDLSLAASAALALAMVARAAPARRRWIAAAA